MTFIGAALGALLFLALVGPVVLDAIVSTLKRSTNA